jgi:dolichyl-phosphate-mannose-protein mannosyltransferase
MRKVAVAVLVACVVAVGVRWGSFVAGGSDSYCYLHQAQRWASGRLQVPEPLALEAPWPDGPLTFAPAGHRPSPTVPGAIVPICPAGLSIVMAAFVAIGGLAAASLVVPLFGALLIWATFLAGARFGQRIGLASALAAACSPIFLYQLVQPMSDVPAAALWMLAVTAVTGTRPSAPALGGLAAGAAILVRPNLFPLAIPMALFILWRPERAWRDRLRGAATFAACAAPGCAAVAAIQRAFYGSALSSGYGSLEALFGLDHVAPNAVRYVSWLSQAHTPVWLLAGAAPFILPGALTRLFLALFLVNLACYLPYVVFEDWSYLRFLLPTIPLLVIMVIASVDGVCRRLAPWTVRPAVAIAAVVLAVLWVREAGERHAFRLQAFEARFERAGAFVGRRLPPNAMVITSWESGSVRLYGGRKTLVWDVLDPAWLDRAIDYVRMRGFEPFLLFETWEEPLFRQRFAAGSVIGRLDWPPAAEIASQVRIYRPDDRDRYLRGIQGPTEYSR